LSAHRRVGIDTGGTFTDAVLSDGKGGWTIYKRPTTPRTPALAVLDALHELAPMGDGPVELVHGTTHATNALLTGNLGKVAFVVTKGFRDLLAIGRQERESLYALEPNPPRPRQPRARIVEVRERIAAQGQVVEKMESEEVERVVARAASLRPQTIAICLLHAHRNPRHERLLKRALKGLGVPIILSSELAPEEREFERATTAWADAGLVPVVAPALHLLTDAVHAGWGATSAVQIQRSDGGVCSAAAAVEHPIHLALSGPAGGLSAARTLADARGDGSILTLDMGGTSTDVALVPRGEWELKPMTVGGLGLLSRGLPVHTVGTGGGSLAHQDLGGELRVGPQSAGAQPGPACYGRGGEQATVTDAHLLAGRLHSSRFLGGEFSLDEAAAEQSLARGRCTPEEVLEVATAGMERALRKVSLAEGHDPRQLTMMAFGGAGGLHAAWLAERLGIPRVVIPPNPGAFSALGMLAAPKRRTVVKSILNSLPTVSERAASWKTLVQKARQQLAKDGVAGRNVQVRRVVELASEGQAGVFALAEGPRLVERFHSAYQQRFGFQRRDAPIICKALRVQVDGPAPSPWKKVRMRTTTPQPVERRWAMFPEHKPRAVRCRADWYEREFLSPGSVWRGPALVAEYSGTTAIPRGWSASIDGWSCLVLEKEPVARGKR